MSFCKKNRFLFIPPTSFHENHKWIQEYVNRIRLICSENEEYNKHAHNLHSQLSNRAHSTKDIQQYFKPTSREELINKVLQKRNNNNNNARNKSAPPIVFKITRTPRTIGIKQELKEKLRLTQYALADPDTKKIFNNRSTPLLCEKRPKNISDTLVRATIKPNPQR